MFTVWVRKFVCVVSLSYIRIHTHEIRSTAKDSMDKYKSELARLRPVGSKIIETSSSDQGLRGGKSPSAFKVYERNVMPRLRHAHPTKPEDELIKLCKKEWAGISEKEKRTYQVPLYRSRGRARSHTHTRIYMHMHMHMHMHTCTHAHAHAHAHACTHTHAHTTPPSPLNPP
jgi:hypothetical protein